MTRPLGRLLRWGSMVLVAALALVVTAAWFSSRLPDRYNVMSMGTVDLGRTVSSAAGGHAGHGSVGAIAPGAATAARETSVRSLVTDPSLRADVVVDLVATQGRVRLPDGGTVDGFALNGETPGPTITAVEGQLIEVRVRNDNVTEGMTLHWHGVDVPNAEDGVAGVTQDAILPGGRHVYRFVAQAGTYWYHSHQVSDPQVRGGLLGALVVAPSDGEQGSTVEAAAPPVDVIALSHTYGGKRTLNGLAGESRVAAPAGSTVRLRVINTDPGPMPVWVTGTAYKVVAVDGRDLNEPGVVEDRSILVTAGGRADLEVTIPRGGAVRLQVAGASLVVGDGPAPTPARAPAKEVELLSYGTPAPLGFNPAAATRSFDYVIGRRLGFLDGKPGMWWTINGQMYPDVPMFMVSEGDVVRMRVVNDSGEVHPMHLHGHHAVVLSRNGIRASGSPWWVDSLNVEDGESFDIAFVADNPGIWMDHCHNLRHAREGLVAHLAYAGVTSPFVIGGDVHNTPE
ncbi:multicopper oxidase family protein [Knoellia sinensis]|uniref:multicopper oxidase family protein n=1 Tax=Knoellia sinensis TaxID=136100 RepID=UPI001FDEADF1|nr:multicopper oxidase family protein [Knoellia sinensis]